MASWAPAGQGAFDPLTLGEAGSKFLFGAAGALEPPIRAVLFGAARFAEHGRSLALAHDVAAPHERRATFFPRLKENLDVLRSARTLLEEHALQGHQLAPAAGWLIDNGTLLEQQLDTVRDGLPTRYFEKLPRLHGAPLEGLPRVYGIAWAWVAHTDSGVDEALLESYLGAYQRERELTLAELWAVPTTIRVVVIENLRRLAERAAAVQAARDAAHRWIELPSGSHAAGATHGAGAAGTAGTAGGATGALALQPLLQRIGHALETRGVLEAFALQLQRRSDEWSVQVAPDARAWLQLHLPDPAGALARQQQQAAEDHHSVRNAVTALRTLDTVDWRGIFMRTSAVLAGMQALPVFAAEAERTQDLSLQRIETLALRHRLAESAISGAVVRLASGGAAAVILPGGVAAGPRSGDTPTAHQGDAAAAPLYWLRRDAPGHPALLAALGVADAAAPWRAAWRQHLATPAYLAGLAAATALVVLLVLLRYALPGTPAWALAVTALLLAWPASEAVIAALHRLVSESMPPHQLARLALDDGIPREDLPLVVIPAILSAGHIGALAEQLEQHHLANPERHAQFALLTDWADADAEHAPLDGALLEAARRAVESLNERYDALPADATGQAQPDAPQPDAPQPGPLRDGAPRRFLLLHRARRWSDTEQRWIGWERKRGKLEQLVAWLATPGTASPFLDLGPLSRPAPAIRRIVTLDSDTDMPPGRLRELVAIASHPLNRPVVDAVADTTTRRITAGYGILQPRLATPLPVPGSVTPFHWLFSGQWGIDPYSVASSEVYEDLFGEGSFSGKGLLDVAAVHATLTQRLPEGQVLSHDLLEGTLARCATVSDVTLVETTPALPDVAASRLHRWTRGDWQLLPFIVQPRRWPMAGINRWKMFDNLRRTLVAPMGLLLLVWAFVSATLPVGVALATVAAAYGAGPLLGALAGLAPTRDDVALGLFFRRAGGEVLRALGAAVWQVAQLLAQVLMYGDAIARALWRQFVSRRHLLQWTTAAAAEAAARTDLGWLWRRHAAVPVAALAIGLSVELVGQAGAPVQTGWAWSLAALWALSPLWTWIASKPLPAPAETLDDGDRELVRALAFDTWRYYARHVGADEHHLPPDNVQINPSEMVAHRTSPTNIGLYLLVTAAARELGIIGVVEMAERLQGTLDTLDLLPRWRGHFYNWYDTQTLAVLQPAYVSSVDSGNLSGHLLVAASACEALAAQADWSTAQRGALAASARRLASPAPPAPLTPLAPLAPAMSSSVMTGAPALASLALQDSPDAGTAGIQALPQRLAQARGELDALLRGQRLEDSNAAMRRLHDHVVMLQGWQRDSEADADALRAQLRRLAGRCRALALAADFGALYDRKRRLLHIGYRLDGQQLDQSYYDLLASESRLASLVGIAKGDLPPRHWGTLGRPFFASAGAGGNVGLKSWSGSMFEYLMPSLVLDEPAGSVLHQALASAVAEQRADAALARKGRPWGVSESAIAVQDHTLAYQYGPQGVERLALRRTPPDEHVVAPYATVMALLVAPRAAADNLRRLELLGARRGMGFIEALDYTQSRQPPAQGPAGSVADGGDAADAAGADRKPDFVAVETFMAHHQGMALLACAHVLTGGAVRRWAHADPHLRAVTSLLHEPAPHQAPPLRERAVAALTAPQQRLRFQLDCEPQATALPPTHLLGNGRYALALRANGAGYSQWQGQGITRWRDDALRDAHGLFGYVRRQPDGAWSSLSAHPAGDADADYRSEFHPDRVLLHARWPDLHVTTTVSVSTVDDCELRRVTLRNSSRRVLRLQVAMAFEVTLAPQRADEAHPAFSKLFVSAGWSAAENAMYLERRPRLAHEPAVHAVHFLAGSEGMLHGVQAVADRAQWLGRLGSASAPLDDFPQQSAAAADSGGLVPLDTGLDPVSVISVTLTLAPGASTTLTFGLGCADDRESLQALVDRYRNVAGAQRARGLSDTLARIRLQELRLDPDTWSAWLHLNTLLTGALTRPLPADAQGIDRRHLWRHGTSGDKPIALLWIESTEGVGLACQAASLLPLWTAAGLSLDLVIVNAEPPSYLAGVQQALAALNETAAQRSDPQVPAERRANLKLLNAHDLHGGEAQALRALARVSLRADGRSLAQQLDRLRLQHDDDLAERARQPASLIPLPVPRPDATLPAGRFDAKTAAYRFAVSPSRYPARPWINVLANPEFGCQVSEAGAGFTWAVNSRLHQVTSWSNDALCDPASEAVLLEDLDSGHVWLLGRGLDTRGRDVLHGIGSTRMRQHIEGLEIEITWCVDVELAVKQTLVTVQLRRGDARRLRLVGFAEWTLGGGRSERASLFTRATRWTAADAPVGLPPAPGSSGFALQATQLDAGSGQPGATAFLGWRIAAAGAVRPAAADAPDWTCDRREFFDVDGRWVLPARLRAKAGAGLDACAGVACRIDVASGQPVRAALLLGHASNQGAAEALARAAWLVEPAARLQRQQDQWPALLGVVDVQTPDPAFDALVNRWLPYQAIACRLWARAGFYQAGGAFGFRDQLQDAMGLADRQPQLLRDQIKLHASRQFLEGDVQHWWHEPGGAGVRTRMTDDLLWLPYAVAHSLKRAGQTPGDADAAWLDAQVPFLRSAPVPDGQEDLYETPATADDTATVYEHAARTIDHSLTRVGMGAHGLPLIGTGDWNDGMNRVGHHGKGESVWLGWFLCRVIDDFAPVAEARAEHARAQHWRAARATLADAIEREGWDGAWYRRAYFDDGTPLGSSGNTECRIDLIAQAWSVLAGVARPQRAAQAMASARELLWNADAGVMQLLAPPLANAEPSAGYIQAYPPGIRENAGQYNHGAVWALMAFAELGDATWAWRMFTALSPAHRSADPRLGAAYAIEPYVMAGDVYSQPPYAARGGWSWYTGAAAWLQRAALESICGVVVEGDVLRLRPCLPPHWPQAVVTLQHGSASGQQLVHRITLCRDDAAARAVLPALQVGGAVQRVRAGETVDLRQLTTPAQLLLLLDETVPEQAAGHPVANAAEQGTAGR